jgi:hypothetical protein
VESASQNTTPLPEGGEKTEREERRRWASSYCNQRNSQQSNAVPFIWISGKTKEEIKLTANAPSVMPV